MHEKVKISRIKVDQLPEDSKRNFCIEIAGHTVKIETMYENTFRMCEKYLCDLNDKMPDIHVVITNDDIEYERREASNNNLRSENGYLETLAVYRKISESMIAYDTFLMHGAVIAYADSAVMFTAESGTGKTTHIRKWLNELENSYVVNGDKPLIKITDNHVVACGTPWCGKEKMGTNAMVSLKAIVLMERGTDNVIEEIPYSQAFNYLLHQTYRPISTQNIIKTLKLISQLQGKVRFWRFKFNNYKDDSFSVAYSVLNRS